MFICKMKRVTLSYTLSLAGPAPRVDIVAYDNKEGTARPFTFGLLTRLDRTLAAPAAGSRLPRRAK